MPKSPNRRRLALSASGPVSASGDPRWRTVLHQALAASEAAESRLLTHGFHSYPARSHPLLARRLADSLSPQKTVLDPFVGSGTTLIEAARRGARGFGVDINPLAIALSRLKTSVFSEGELQRL